MGFKVELFNETELNYILHGLKHKAENDKRFDNTFLNSLKSRKHWQILDFFDGTKNRSGNVRKQIQFNTLCDFDETEIQSYYNAAVNMAISGNPYPGYDVLHEYVAGDLNSMFYDSITLELQKEINNGRFWENLRELSLSLNYGIGYSKIEDVLINHFGDIDIKSISKYLEGIKIGYLGGGNWETRGKGLSQRAIKQYANLLESIDQDLSNLSITEEDFSKMVIPYIKTLQETDRNENHLMDDFEERLKSPLVKKYKKFLEPANI